MVLWVDLCSVSLPCGAVGRSVFCVSSLRCCGLICVLCLFLVVQWVDLCSVSLPLWCCGLICVLCLFLTVLWVDLYSVSLPCGAVG